MGAAAPAGDPAFYGAVPHSLFAQLGDPEDNPPNQIGHDFCNCWECSRPRASSSFEPFMNDEKDDIREALTDAAPPPSETRDTQPPDPIAEAEALKHMSTMLPAARTPSSFKDLAVEDVAKMQRQLLAGLAQLLDPDGRLEQQTKAISAVVEGAAQRQMQSYDLLRQDMLRRFELTDARDKDQDAKLAAVTAELVVIRSELANLRERLATQEASQAAQSAQQQKELADVLQELDKLETRWKSKNDDAQGPTPQSPEST